VINICRITYDDNGRNEAKGVYARVRCLAPRAVIEHTN